MGSDAALYLMAASCLHRVQQRKGTVASLCLNSKFGNKKRLYALVSRALRYSSVVRQILDHSGVVLRLNKTQPCLELVLVYDELFGRGVRCGGRLQGAVASQRAALRTALAQIKAKNNVSTSQELLPVHVRNPPKIPRYFRVNLIKATVDDVIDVFVHEGYVVKSGHVDSPADLGPKDIARDRHLEDVLLMAMGTPLHNHALYTNGSIVLQDKASCMAAHALSPPVGAFVIDACAAPGNKTTHLAAMVGTTGRVFAFDRDERRLNTLRQTVERTGAGSIVEAVCADFLAVDPNDVAYAQVTHILLDPSCSGSGMVQRWNSLADEDEEVGTGHAQRLESLSSFQLKALLHAFRFPTVTRVSYSTCSVHRQENEDVVEKALGQQTAFVLANALPSFEGRGLGDAGSIGSRCVRVVSEQHHAQGFFVAVFERCKQGSSEDAHRQERSAGSGQTRGLEAAEMGAELVAETNATKQPMAGPEKRTDSHGRPGNPNKKRKKRKH